MRLLENPFWRFVWPIPATYQGIWYRRQWRWWGRFWKYYWCRIVGHIPYEIDHRYGGAPFSRTIWCWRCSESLAQHRTCGENPEHGYADAYHIHYHEDVVYSRWGNEYDVVKDLCPRCVDMYQRNMDSGVWPVLKRITAVAVEEC